MKKSTNAEIKKRVTEVYKMLIQAYTYTDIVRYCSENYNVSSRTADQYIWKAKEQMRIDNTQKREELLVEANARYNDLYNQLRKEGKYRDAGYMQTQKNKVNGLEQVSFTVTNEKSDVADRLQEIFEKTVRAKNLDQ